MLLVAEAAKPLAEVVCDFSQWWGFYPLRQRAAKVTAPRAFRRDAPMRHACRMVVKQLLSATRQFGRAAKATSARLVSGSRCRYGTAQQLSSRSSERATVANASRATLLPAAGADATRVSPRVQRQSGKVKPKAAPRPSPRPSPSGRGSLRRARRICRRQAPRRHACRRACEGNLARSSRKRRHAFHPGPLPMGEEVAPRAAHLPAANLFDNCGQTRMLKAVR